MPLYDVTFPNKTTHVDPADAIAFNVLQKVKKESASNTWDRLIKTVDEAVNWAEQDKDNKLVWTKTGALFGESSKQPLVHVNHLWEKIGAAVNNDKHCLQAVGGLLRWRISLRNDIWLAYRQDIANGAIDPDTGRIIKVSTYWIDNSFVYLPPPKKAQVTANQLQGLADSWGASLR